MPAQLRKKLDARSHKCVFLGVSQESKAYRLYDPTNKKIVISRDVIFDEDASWNWSKENQVQQELIIKDDEVQESQQEDENREGPQTPSHSLPTPNSGGTSPQIQSMSQTEETSEVSSSPVSPDSENSRVHNTPIPQIGSPVRNRRPPAWTNDYYMSEDMFNEDEAGFAMYSVMDDPTMYEEACKEDKWVQAMNAVITAIERNHTWELIDPPTRTKPIGVKWVYKKKINELGKVDKYKARLVVKGYAQREGVDYNSLLQWLIGTQSKLS